MSVKALANGFPILPEDLNMESISLESSFGGSYPTEKDNQLNTGRSIKTNNSSTTNGISTMNG
eukprot:CAMPEP_0196594026 /NCGR_PEP_ID=MMETSP1081-20130531/77180_1 /TAXON_ID=36882 /ORGANISM="Pyramimonas amylifera, Strain CCMP720" /LENGTH=62 /DNA_ID=CAMNT_0041918175 /DNA_START=77 /DNA_END=262 /DNA_ORIENTATION=+